MREARPYAAGGQGGQLPPQKFSKQKKKKKLRFLDFLIVVSVNQNIMQLK